MLIFDIETGPLPLDQLRALYVEPTFEQFCESCDQRWKPETREAKFAEAKANGWQKFIDKAALDPTTGQVLAIGYLSIKTKGRAMVMDDGGEDNADAEFTLLSKFWEQYVKCHKAQPRPRAMVGLNIFGFDLPFLVRRSWILGVDIPTTVKPGRFFDPLFCDLGDVWLCGQRWGEFPASLNAISKALGVGEKTGNGADFAELLKTDREAAMVYLRSDLELTAACATRMGVI